MTIRHSRLFLIALAMALPFGQLCAYKCTFKNSTTRAEIKVKFYRAALMQDKSQVFTLYPGEEASWDTGIALVTGLQIVEMKYFPSGKIVPGGGVAVPGINKVKDRWKGHGRAVSQTWEMFEIKHPIDENKSTIQFTLRRLPAGVFYPGGEIWNSNKFDIIEGLQKVQVVQ